MYLIKLIALIFFFLIIKVFLCKSLTVTLDSKVLLMDKICCFLIQNQIIPSWLEVFLNKTFFGACSNHGLQKNELNMYCITCDLAACRYCLATGLHNNHNLLKIYRHVYQDVVPLKAMEEHIDCSNIQVLLLRLNLIIIWMSY